VASVSCSFSYIKRVTAVNVKRYNFCDVCDSIDSCCFVVEVIKARDSFNPPDLLLPVALLVARGCCYVPTINVDNGGCSSVTDYIGSWGWCRCHICRVESA